MLTPMSKMTAIVLGSGTSQGVPMIGCRCAVSHSADPRDKRTRSSLYVATPQVRLLVDTTPDLRQQSLREGLDRVDAVLFTHAHADHTMGFDDLRRFCEIKGGPLPIYGSEPTLAQIERTFFYAFNPGKIIPGYVHVLPHIVTGPFRLGELEIAPLPVPHGSVSTLGFLFSHGGRKLLAYLSDCASVPEPVRDTVAGAVEAAGAIGARQSFITHLTHEKNHVEREQGLPPAVRASYDGMKIEFELG